MRGTYKSVFITHAILGIGYLLWVVVLMVLNRYEMHELNAFFIMQIVFAMSLWLLIEKRLFLPAYYVAIFLTATTTYHFYIYGMRQLSDANSTVGQLLQFTFYISVPLFFVFIYFHLAYYPRKVLQTAKKLKLP